MIKVHFMKQDHSRNIDLLIFQYNHAAVLEGFRTGGWYEHVANVRRPKECVNALENAYTNMQNGVHTESWGRFPADHVEPIIGSFTINGKVWGNRSSMVGDIYEDDDGVLWIVASFGFVNLEDKATRQIFVKAPDLKPQNVARIDGKLYEIIENHSSVLGCILVTIPAYDNTLTQNIQKRYAMIEILNEEDAKKFRDIQVHARGRIEYERRALEHGVKRDDT